MSEPFDAFDAALVVRDALMACSCCTDEEQGQERYDAAHELLTWVTEAKARIAVLEAIAYPSEAAARRQPLTNAERQARYRATHRVTKRNETHNEASNGAVTKGVTPAPSQTLPAEEKQKQASKQNLSAKEETKNARQLASDARDGVTDDVTPAVTDSVTARDACKAWHGAMHEAGAQSLHAEHAWRDDYETIAAACNGADGDKQLAASAVCRWFWLAPDGPVRRLKMSLHYVTPAVLSKRVSGDLHKASAWLAAQETAAQ